MVNIVTHILYATDFSPSAAPALRYAVEWAKVFEASLTILHVLPSQSGLDIDAVIAQPYFDEHRKVAREQLQRLLQEVSSDIPKTDTELRRGVAADQICQVAAENKSDLIITGSHGWTGFNHVIFGSVAERVIQRAPCPVLTVRDRDPEEIAGMHALQVQPRHLVLPVDFTDASMDAYEYAVQVAKWFDAPLTLVHAIEPLSYSLDFTLTHPLQDRMNREKVEQRLRNLTEVLSQQGLTARYELINKPSVEAIKEVGASQQADLILMGTHGRKGLARMILGSTTFQLLEKSPYPVLTVKSPKFEGGHHPTPSTETGEHS